jgi:putative aldouronate transport system permease protein
LAIRRSKGEAIFEVANTIIMILMMLICVYPLLYVIFASFSDPHRLAQHRGVLISSLGFTIKGYELVLKNPNIATGYVNTIFYVIAGTSVNLIMTALGAYVLSRRRAYWSDKMMFAVVFTMYFSGGLIPSYLLVKNLGMMNSALALIIPGAISTWNLIIMRTSFLAIPVSLEESARIDGANDLTILFKIILPLSLPVMAVMALFYGVHHWNAWFNAMMYLRNRALYPLQLILREILIQNSNTNMIVQSDVSQMDIDIYRSLVQYCTIIVATGPILLVYPFLQKYFVKGVMVGAIKG